ncbi:MAG TPA: peptidyl-alpha-hydroxyglycine alpha-amidating lyase family protein [Thermomicrobiaceae bacterium]|nr:peptidyl-alpha-hydroxyglycine alpha-amidating lyase family protein [Thermomicrobiaceae bacterium]
MTATVGSGAFTYEPLESWGNLPEGMRLIECPGVAVDANDRVFVLTRNPENPIVIFESDGSYVGTFGKGSFTDRSHGITITPDGSIYCVDDGTHTVTKWTPEGELVMTIGVPGQPAPAWSGQPFNRPTHVAQSPITGHLYVTDGYGNARIHKYTPDGELVKSWGEPGIDPGQFLLPHNIAIDENDLLYVADREAHRVQVFDADGNVVTCWSNIYRPDGLTLGPDGNIYIGELSGNAPLPPGIGHRVSILDRQGNLLARFGDPEEGDAPGKFIAPHGVAVDSHGDVYVSEVCYTIRGRAMQPPTEYTSLKKLRRMTPAA